MIEDVIADSTPHEREVLHTKALEALKEHYPGEFVLTLAGGSNVTVSHGSALTAVFAAGCAVRCAAEMVEEQVGDDESPLVFLLKLEALSLDGLLEVMQHGLPIWTGEEEAA